MATNNDVLTLIKDENKRRFTIDDIPDRDTDVFYTNFIAPLLRLRDSGVIEQLAELPDRQNRVVLVEIVGGINLDEI